MELSDAYIQAYYGKVVAYVQKNMGADGVLVDPESHNPTVTDNERIILALTAIGKDPANVGGKNLLTALQDRNIMQVTDTSKTDINGLVFGLLALNSGNYTQDSYWLVQAILTQRNKDGSWSSSADTKPDGDVDMTAMALQALAKYRDRQDVADAVERGLTVLSQQQEENGGFVAYDSESSESVAQVIVALTELGVSLTDSRFVKSGNTLVSRLLEFRTENGAFRHILDGEEDVMATEQGFYALVAVSRAEQGKSTLYTMTET